MLRASYDHGGRPTAMTLPTDPDYDDGPAPEIGGTLEYNARGLPSRVNLVVDAASRAIVDELVYTRDGLVEEVHYGDDLEGDGVSSRTPTVSFTTYDDRRRPIRMRTERAPNSHGELGARPLEDVTEPHNQMLVWDLADNLIAIEDLRDPTEWPDGFRPQSVRVTHDSLYRVAGAEYEYTQDSGSRTAVDDTSASNDWRTEMAVGRTNDPMRTAPAPLVSDEPDQRVVSMTWSHDWLGNMQSWDDDSAVFYERSLGDIVNGADLPSEAPSRRTGALYVASNLPEEPVTADDGGWVEVRYGEDGNALAVTVHGRCGSPLENSIALDCRSATDDPEEAIALSCAYSCATEQHYTYAWDEVNRIAHARRLDREDGGDWELAVEQRYLYDASNQRTAKTTTFRGLESGTERTALYVYPGDFERRGLERSSEFSTFGPGRYEAVSGDTETQYGVGGARIVWRTETRADTLDRDQRITLSLTDLIQSTTAVIDLATGELVEAGSYYANGARETYRSNETETVTPEPMGFTGKEADEEVGLTYFGHRYLMAHLGRWASTDPLQTHQVGGGEAINGYHYVSGNVLQARDPVGLKSDAPGQSSVSKQVGAPLVPAQAAGDERFGQLPLALQRAVATRAAEGEEYGELMRTATWQPGPAGGFHVRGPSAEEFLTVLRTAMVLDGGFRARVLAQDASATPVAMRAFPQATRIYVDGAEAGRGGAFGTHVVDMGDLLAYDSITNQARDRPLGTTREQQVVHFVVEAISEVEQTGGGQPQHVGTQLTPAGRAQWRPVFREAHRLGTIAENAFRARMGQAGEIVSRGRPTAPGGGVFTRTVVYSYRGAPDELTRLSRSFNVLSVEDRGAQ